MKDYTVEDDFGRRTVFVGEHLIDRETTDNTEGTKPQWLEVDVWRTAAGKFVVRRVTKYRINHATDGCPRADGYALSPSRDSDTYLCPSCKGDPVEGWRQDDRITVDAYDTPQDLILGFANEGRYNNLARAILADISEQDERVDAVWNTVVVP